MKPKGLLVAVVLLAVLGGVIWWSNKKQAQKEKAPAADTTHQDRFPFRTTSSPKSASRSPAAKPWT